MLVKFELCHEHAKLPTKGTKQSAGWDLYAPFSFTLASNEIKKIPLGLKCEMPEIFFGLIKDRASLGSKGIVVHAGVIDSDFVDDQWQVVLQNLTDDTMCFSRGDRIAQVIFLCLPYISVEAGQVSKTSRGGFGSTGR